MTLKQRFKDIEYARVGNFGNDVSTPRTRRLAMWHFYLFDHAFLRDLWQNLWEIAPGVWRSNQPSPKRLKKYKRMGIETVLSLRGDPNKRISFMLLEKQACEELGIELITTSLSARSLAQKETYLDLLDLLETLKKPFLFHCKSGADRAGLVSALYLLHIEGASIDEARKQLNWRYMHLKSTKTGVLDHMLDCYEADTKRLGDMPIRTWFESHYDRAAITSTFNPLWKHS
ncbi:tyrosine phosphatase family protein [Pacificibacter maritimus]|uniref:Tyrosine phosphatase family protein n=1 Tax=Pacificibacter maritimus TaxID=762213 RepID=A0A3N4ULS6_9RHOB|nr:tyrosine-protein phosphatase [Pacificibacter maritimus]RPE70968.1 tyrosine phosphatase family protein [Pacificibacter maritimus]